MDRGDLAALQYVWLALLNQRQPRILVILYTFKDVKCDVDDAEWMMEHWPRLTRIEGREGYHLVEVFGIILLR